MTQSSHHPLSILKNANNSTTSLEKVPSTRSRSGSFLRAISTLHFPHPTATPSVGNQSPALSITRTNSTNSNYSSISRFSSTNDETVDYTFNCNSNDIEIKDPMGYGSSAIVYDAIYKPKNTRIAVKMIDLDLFERNQIDELRRETTLMALSKHPNVLKVYGSFVNDSKLYIITPYLSGGSCSDIMRSGFQNGFEEVIIATILKQALEGLVYLHKNGHIHRDIKAGNLLVDDQGTVVLADFGVSSSLTDNNNEVRKTFVGTPCWMAPEIMEQSAYDYKADVWSFGITALELATGHAPFAKFSPMKVLMMTLNHRSPTLDRQNGQHKYTQTFKDMIDLCLQKDPSKRPTTEKLLHHPFFKQAKRKDYLVKSVLASIPPLEKRAHRKRSFKQTTVIEDTLAQWDFDTPNVNNKGAEQQVKLVNSNNIITPIQKHMSSFNSAPPVIKNEDKNLDLPSPALSPDFKISAPIPVRKSRFIIEEEHTPMDKSYETLSSQRSISPHNVDKNDSYFTTDNPSKYTHFEIQDGNWQSTIGLGLGISSDVSAAQQQQEQLGVKKGRFSVNQHLHPPAIKTTNITGIDHKNDHLAPDTPLDTYSPSNLRIQSDDIAKGEYRKSRFEVQHSAAPSTPQSLNHGTLDADLSVDKSHSRHQHSLSRESINSCKVSRFLIEREEPATTTEPINPTLDTPMCAPGSSECLKKGRFELSGGNIGTDRTESNQTTVDSKLFQTDVSNHRVQVTEQQKRMQENLELLLRQSQAQTAVLQSLLQGKTKQASSTQQTIPTSRSRSSSIESRKIKNTFEHYSEPQVESNNTKVTELSIPSEIETTMERLQQLLMTSSREKCRLRKENMSLRREIERLKAQQYHPIVIPQTPATTGILKSPPHPLPTPSISLKVPEDETSVTTPPLILNQDVS